jgi:hypothetical protein
MGSQFKEIVFMHENRAIRSKMARLLMTALLWASLPSGLLQPSAMVAAPNPVPASALAAAPRVAQQAASVAAPNADTSKEIVYIDGSGVIRVFDYSFSEHEVKWFSPEGGWRDFALGDFNNDGDMEIVAIGGDANTGRLTIYDPVVASGATNPDQLINGIPWEQLFTMTAPGAPQFVRAGNFDDNLPGDEIIYLYEIRDADKENPSDRLRMFGLKPDNPAPTGRGWVEHFTQKFTQDWEYISVGDLDGRTTDEIAFVSEDDTTLRVYRVDDGVRSIFEHGSSSRPPRGVAIGRWEGGTRNFLAWTRDSDVPLPAFYVSRWESDGNFAEVTAEAFEPAPRVLFFAQINNNADHELVMLRQVVSSSNAPRMIVRGRSQSQIPGELEQRLDSDNGYRAGAAGDIDGDGLDEIVLIRDNRMLVFYEPDRSARNNVYDFSTNRRSIAIGDLDKNGFVFGQEFFADRTEVNGVVESGGPPKTELIALTNRTTSDPIPFAVEVVGNPSWLTVSATGAQTPAQLIFTFNSTGLQAGDYVTDVKLTSPLTTVFNQPYIIKANLKVTAATLSLQPASLSLSIPCTDTATAQTRVIALDSSTFELRYTAAIVASPDVAAAEAALTGPIYDGYVNEEGEIVLRDGQGNEAAVPVNGDMVNASGVASNWPSAFAWISARSLRDFAPDQITIQASTMYSETTRFGRAILVIVADSRAGAPPGNVRLVPITNLCATDYQMLPLIVAKRQ